MSTSYPSHPQPLSTSNSQKFCTPTGINFYKNIYQKSEKNVKNHSISTSISSYDQDPKVLQVAAVQNLIQGRNTFLLAGKGYSKSHIAELYYKMIPQKSRTVVVVFNPFALLGDIQVLEKQLGGFSEINLTKLTSNPKTANKISKGKFLMILATMALGLGYNCKRVRCGNSKVPENTEGPQDVTKKRNINSDSDSAHKTTLGHSFTKHQKSQHFSR
ncbi:hypothetical protein VP01_3664g2 [Puccinia sorghi]|uniref:Uncharacterized protein n=1 Tax=Puccinia sorghi TaxID=27349 RepID=A0A0L6UUJ8_9BASI|nr:hypothetical protein VP01_3664g2 [Puccinia sorghi]